MRIAYFLNTYPSTSQTFIRTEIRAIEAEGVEVVRFALRRSADPLVTDGDRDEQAATDYLLDGRAGLIAGFFGELARNPGGMARALSTWARLLTNAGGGLIRHGAYLLEAIRLKQRANAAGVAHLHTHFSTNSAAVALLCQRLGGPGYSFTAHGPNEFYDREKGSIGLKVAAARFVVAITHHCRATLAEPAGMAAWDKIHVVRCGVTIEDFAVRPVPADGPLVAVGRLCTEKAQELIPAAIAPLVDRFPELRVEIIGDGPSRPRVQAAIAAQGLEDRITLLGWQSHDAVRARLDNGRALLLPSFAEGLPIVLMEAFALGRPVITTWIAGHPELVTPETGWACAAGDVEGLTSAIAAAMTASKEALTAMGAEGRERVERQHDQRANARELLTLIRTVADRPN
ncbi:MAG: glycosyltransferase family 4 protein [Pseudomonadota bacterium]